MDEVNPSEIETELVDFHETQMNSVFNENLEAIGMCGDTCDCYEDCTICRESLGGTLSKRMTNCGHVFHEVCLFDWLKKGKNCPNCTRLVVARLCRPVYLTLKKTHKGNANQEKKNVNEANKENVPLNVNKPSQLGNGVASNTNLKIADVVKQVVSYDNINEVNQTVDNSTDVAMQIGGDESNKSSGDAIQSAADIEISLVSDKENAPLNEQLPNKILQLENCDTTNKNLAAIVAGEKSDSSNELPNLDEIHRMLNESTQMGDDDPPKATNSETSNGGLNQNSGDTADVEMNMIPDESIGDINLDGQKDDALASALVPPRTNEDIDSSELADIAVGSLRQSASDIDSGQEEEQKPPLRRSTRNAKCADYFNFKEHRCCVCGIKFKNVGDEVSGALDGGNVCSLQCLFNAKSN